MIKETDPIEIFNFMCVRSDGVAFSDDITFGLVISSEHLAIVLYGFQCIPLVLIDSNDAWLLAEGYFLICNRKQSSGI